MRELGYLGKISRNSKFILCLAYKVLGQYLQSR
jgi:hypothetical protein